MYAMPRRTRRSSVRRRGHVRPRRAAPRLRHAGIRPNDDLEQSRLPRRRWHPAAPRSRAGRYIDPGVPQHLHLAVAGLDGARRRAGRQSCLPPPRNTRITSGIAGCVGERAARRIPCRTSITTTRSVTRSMKPIRCSTTSNAIPPAASVAQFDRPCDQSSAGLSPAASSSTSNRRGEVASARARSSVFCCALFSSPPRGFPGEAIEGERGEQRAQIGWIAPWLPSPSSPAAISTPA